MSAEGMPSLRSACCIARTNTGGPHIIMRALSGFARSSLSLVAAFSIADILRISGIVGGRLDMRRLPLNSLGRRLSDNGGSSATSEPAVFAGPNDAVDERPPAKIDETLVDGRIDPVREITARSCVFEVTFATGVRGALTTATAALGLPPDDGGGGDGTSCGPRGALLSLPSTARASPSKNPFPSSIITVTEPSVSPIALRFASFASPSPVMQVALGMLTPSALLAASLCSSVIGAHVPGVSVADTVTGIIMSCSIRPSNPSSMCPNATLSGTSAPTCQVPSPITWSKEKQPSLSAASFRSSAS
eukprot:Opistho-2@69244